MIARVAAFWGTRRLAQSNLLIPIYIGVEFYAFRDVHVFPAQYEIERHRQQGAGCFLPRSSRTGPKADVGTVGRLDVIDRKVQFPTPPEYCFGFRLDHMAVSASVSQSASFSRECVMYIS